MTESTLCSGSIPNNRENAENAKLRLEEQVIDEVRQRPPLWNFKLPLAERGIRVKERLWQEVAVELNGILYRLHNNRYYCLTLLIACFNKI